MQRLTKLALVAVLAAAQGDLDGLNPDADTTDVDAIVSNVEDELFGGIDPEAEADPTPSPTTALPTNFPTEEELHHIKEG